MKPGIPLCPLCGVRLVPDGEIWACPRCRFHYQVVRGRPGRPLWGAGPGREVEGGSMEEAFKSYLLSHGWTEESYGKLSPEGKRLLFQRWMERSGLAPPRE
jgi:hypothetical protein